MKIIALIPCRYRSKRFPGKSLALIKKKPMMWHVYRQSQKSKLVDQTFIVTDDKRIYDKCIELKLNCIMSKKNHINGTDRIAECIKYVNADIYVNVQGDEPLISPIAINSVINKLIKNKNPNIIATNGFHKIKNNNDIKNPNIIKTTFDKNKKVISFSRNVIPFSYSKNFQYYRQVGLYAFTKKGLAIFNRLKPKILEKTETVEMFRIIENGYSVQMVDVKKPSISVDTPSDLKKIKKIIK